MSKVHSINLYAVQDAATGTFGNLLEARSDAEALRSFRHHLQSDSQSLYALSPEDYTLWRLGSVDKETGVFTSNSEMLSSARSILAVVSAVSAVG